MKMVVVAVFDAAAQAFTVPQFVGHRGIALRSFRDACNVKESAFGKHPEDYDLYEIGSYDDISGLLECYPGQSDLIARGKDMVTGE